MSFITKTITEEMITPASLIQLEKILIKHGYTVTKTKFSISANKKSFWKSQTSTITIIDTGENRECRATESSAGLLMTPDSGNLATIILEAEQEI